ncbi:D-alanine transaminase [Tistlia consotensis]|uniref:Probable branched-chain-amino-acid aminotransferase n=1 Tax=Tistlia consotensis USBA 355 TaxID=560819 RepID=A0A1Y6B8F6_9PROT|nr:D-amino-acid transaminase [Tistlia consotensis]SME89832.1 D-alanine transaminase [Tistlia consotensis USBA 355]SNR26344.1 D-alanine transaminase [Tistlia consotensis]
MRQVYVNGRYLPEGEATVSVFDRGFLFADAVYEVTAVLDGKLVDFAGHLARLRRSLKELGMALELSDEELLAIHRELVRLNGIDEGLIYLQITRGNAGDRDFLFPDPATPKTVVLFTQKKKLLDSPLAARGQRIVTVEDLRWRRCDIKTVQLLYPSMIKELAKKQGADDAWMVRDGLVTEGSSNNAYIVTAEGAIVTRDLSSDILHGITRKAVLDCAADLEMTVEERPFTVEEAKAAKEAFSTSASGFVNPVVEIDGATIGSGKPGPVAARLRQIYLEKSRAAAI